ncbi:MAG: hypothetical protein ACJ715_07500, partial [Ornithinibacter sp.]
MSEQSPPSATTPDAGAWDAWSTRLADALQGLADRASLTVTAPSGSARPVLLRKARLRGFVPARHEVVTPWVRL